VLGGFAHSESGFSLRTKVRQFTPPVHRACSGNDLALASLASLGVIGLGLLPSKHPRSRSRVRFSFFSTTVTSRNHGHKRRPSLG
jgi:hypothetical protein